MKIYKVCHSVCISLSESAKVLAPDFVNDVRVFTSVKKAIDYATKSVFNYENLMGYKVYKVEDSYIRSWVLDLGATRRVIQVIEDETK